LTVALTGAPVLVFMMVLWTVTALGKDEGGKM
jgi:hypothetical protein